MNKIINNNNIIILDKYKYNIIKYNNNRWLREEASLALFRFLPSQSIIHLWNSEVYCFSVQNVLAQGKNCYVSFHSITWQLKVYVLSFLTNSH